MENLATVAGVSCFAVVVARSRSLQVTKGRADGIKEEARSYGDHSGESAKA